MAEPVLIGNLGNRRLTRRSVLATSSTLALVAMAGCRSAVEESNSTSSEPVQGGTLLATSAAEPVPDAYFTGRPGNIYWNRNVLETLLLIDNDLEIHPVLATDWELSDDNTTFVATIRGGVTYHSGRELTAADVVFALEHALDGGGLTHLNSAMSGWEVEATGDHEVTITSPTPLQEVIFDILDALPIIDSETYEGLEDGSEVVGTGPFVWEEYNAGTDIRLTRNDNYWEPDLPYLDAVEITVIGDSTAQLAALRSGQAHLANGLTIQDAQTIVDDEAFHLDINHGIVYALGLDVTQAPFDDPEVRRAVGYAIDRDRINDQVFGGLGVMTSLPWGEDVTGYPGDLADTYTYDPDQARQIIEDAGADGTDITIALHNQPVPRTIYEIVARDLEEVGFNVSPLELSVADFEPRRAVGDLGPAFLTWTAVADMAPTLMFNAYADLRPDGNPSNHTDDEYEEHVAELVESPDDETTAEALHDVSEYMLDTAFSHTYAIVPATGVRADAAAGIRIGRYGRSMREAYLSE